MGEFRYSYMDFEHNSLGAKGDVNEFSVLGLRACVCIHMPIYTLHIFHIFPYYVIYIHMCTGMYVYVVYHEHTCMQYCGTYPFIES